MSFLRAAGISPRAKKPGCCSTASRRIARIVLTRAIMNTSSQTLLREHSADWKEEKRRGGIIRVLRRETRQRRKREKKRRPRRKRDTRKKGEVDEISSFPSPSSFLSSVLSLRLVFVFFFLFSFFGSRKPGLFLAFFSLPPVHARARYSTRERLCERNDPREANAKKIPPLNHRSWFNCAKSFNDRSLLSSSIGFSQAVTLIFIAA